MSTLLVIVCIDFSRLRGSQSEGLATVLGHPGNTGVALTRMEHSCQMQQPS